MRRHSFVGRDREVAVGLAVLTAESDVRILGICGTSGIGKSFLLTEIAERAVEGGYRHAAIDLSSGATGARPDGLDQSLLDDLVRALLRLGCNPRQQSTRHDRFADRIKAAQNQLRLSHADTKIHMTASDGSIIARSPISHEGGQPTVDHYVAYRAALVDAAVDALRDLRLSKVLLTVDGLEWLTRHDGLSAGTSREELVNWVTHKLLPQLIQVAPELRIIVAGWERLEFPSAMHAMCESLQLGAWNPDETTAYLAERGLHDPQLAALAHHRCSGTPIWLGMLADAYREGKQSGMNADWMEWAKDSAVQEWLHRSFLHRLDHRQQKIVQAAAVLRHITLDGLRALLDPIPVNHDDYGRLYRYTFVQRIPDPDHRTTWLRIHDLVREAFLADGHRSDSMTALHRAAAAWYTAHDNPAEAAYHYFAIGDPTGIERWEEVLDRVLQHNDLSSARTLIETAVAPETGGYKRLRETHMSSVIDLYQGRMACLARDLPEAAELLTRALRGRDRATSRGRTAKAHRWRGAVYRLQGYYPQAEQEIRKSLEVYQDVGDPPGEAHAHRDLGILYRLWDNYPQAEQETGQALELFSANGDQWGEAYAHGELGILYRLWDDYPPAERETRKALDQFEIIGDPLGKAYAHRDLGVLFRLRDDYPQAERETTTALQQFRVLGNRFGQANAHRELGILHRLRDDYPQAERETGRALELYRADGDQWGEIYAHGELGILYRLRDDYSRAEQETGTVLARYRTIGNRWGETYARRELSILHRLRGDYARAEQEISEALELYRTLGNRLGEASARRELGILSRERDDYPRAEQETRKALELYQVIGNRWGDTHPRREAGARPDERADHRRTEQETRKALELYQALGNRWGAANAYSELGVLYRLWGDHARAERESHEALELYRAIGNRLGEAYSRGELGVLHRLSGDYVGAERESHEALELYQVIGNRLGEAYSRGELGVLHRLSGDYVRAERESHEALELYQAIGNRLGEANAHGELGALHLLRGGRLKAEQRYMAARNIYADLGRFQDAQWCAKHID
ncbi:tetratricopeptide repeat protein [Nonomuraea monospora]